MIIYGNTSWGLFLVADAGLMVVVLEEINAMHVHASQAASCDVRAHTSIPLVKQEGVGDGDVQGPGDVVVRRVERIDDVHLDDQLARQLEAELDAEYEMEIASRAPAASAATGLVHGVIYISDDENNDEVDMEEWFDDPEHAKLSETDRKLREQELQDPDVTKMYQEMYDKNDGPREED
ncbi:hypothetical protein ACQJBY_009877 [Aegilops geniculata]